MAVNPRGGTPEYHIYPPELTEPYKTRRFTVGEQMYATMGIPREDKLRAAATVLAATGNSSARRSASSSPSTGRCSRASGRISAVPAIIMLLAREYGLHTCAQEAWAPFHEVIRDYLKVPQEEMIFCGMAVGYADDSAPINSLVSERAPLERMGRDPRRRLIGIK